MLTASLSQYDTPKYAKSRNENQGVILTGAELGGTTFPEPETVQPAGRPGMEVTADTEEVRVEGPETQGQTDGVAYVDEGSACVPSNGIGPPDVVEVIAGAAVSVLLEPVDLTEPPAACMLCQEPLRSPYVYCVPVE